jgi:enterochelin esterase-like enzyme
MIASKILEEQRPLQIRLPRGYEESTQRYPVLYRLDGEFCFSHTVVTVEQLVVFEEAEGVPEMIVVGIPNTNRGRDMLPAQSQYAPENASPARFLEFLKDEVFPFVEEHYRATDTRILAGQSSSGFFAWWAQLQEPQLFAAVAISPSFADCRDFMKREVAAHALDAGLSGSYLYLARGDQGREEGVAESLALLLPLIEPSKGLTVRTQVYEELGHVPFPALYDALKAMGKWEAGIFSAKVARPRAGSTDGHPRQSPDRTKNGASAQLIARAENALTGDITEIWERTYDWSSKRIFTVCTNRRDEGIFVEKETDYIQINSGLRIELLNEILREHRIPREDMDQPWPTRRYLELTVGLCDGTGRCIGSRNFLRNLGSGVSHWTRGSKTAERALRKLCRDPQFVFDGNRWTVEFDVLKPDGGADRWHVTGEFHPETQSNSIDTIKINVLHGPGAFAHMSYG